MKNRRASLSKRARFAIFERDLFACQYCGRRPPETVLQLDHIHPFSKGGEDTEENLITACVDCNSGKSNRVLGAVVPRPDSDAKYLATQQEIAEARLYLGAKQELDAIQRELSGLILDTWQTFMSSWYSKPDMPTILHWLKEYGPDEVEHAIRLAAWRDKKENFQSRTDPTKYVSGILRRRRDEEGGSR